jgi:hypothetical protein
MIWTPPLTRRRYFSAARNRHARTRVKSLQIVRCVLLVPHVGYYPTSNRSSGGQGVAAADPARISLSPGSWCIAAGTGSFAGRAHPGANAAPSASAREETASDASKLPRPGRRRYRPATARGRTGKQARCIGFSGCVGSQFGSQVASHLSAHIRDLNSAWSASFFDISASGTCRTSDCLRAVGR